MEKALVCYPNKTISFIRFGRPLFSKSKLMNTILSDVSHDTFFNKDSTHGNVSRKIGDGLIEGSCYLPAGKESDIFSDVMTFLNLRGDAAIHETQMKLLVDMSTVLVAITDQNQFGKGEVVNSLKTMYQSGKPVLLCLHSDGTPSEDEKKAINEIYLEFASRKPNKVIKMSKGISNNDLKDKVQKLLLQLTEDGKNPASIEDTADVISKQYSLELDEDDQNCQLGKLHAKEISEFVTLPGTATAKKEMLPLQGKTYNEWCQLLKSQKRVNKNADSIEGSLYHKDSIQRNMEMLRNKQKEMCTSLHPLVDTFRSKLLDMVDHGHKEVLNYFLLWLNYYLDNESRKCLPGLQQKYREMCYQLRKAKDEGVPTSEYQDDVDAAEEALADASFGTEHLLREIGQIYEAMSDGGEKSTSLEQLPLAAAKLVLQGYPLEIMNGDAGNVPLEWVKAILQNIGRLVRKKKVFVLSVLGIQSSGKSTLLNSMFGLQFAVSAGRCTRGIFAQLVPVEKKTTYFPFDYILVLDTEGLRAPELGQKMYFHDNELSTLVIGLGDVTVINLKGENMAEVKDVLQIVTHAFLRMKLVNKDLDIHKACMFTHQNVSAVNATDKMLSALQKNESDLDSMTKEAALMEDIGDVSRFKQILDFDGMKHVRFFTNLWNGDPPMAPINPGYSQCLSEVKQQLLADIAKSAKSFLTFPNLAIRIDDLWKGILSEDFVFSFRNTLAARAYDRMQTEICTHRWNLEKRIIEWKETDVRIAFGKCNSEEKLDNCYTHLIEELDTLIGTEGTKQRENFKRFIHESEDADILIVWEEEAILSLRNFEEECSNKFKRDVRKLIRTAKLDFRQNSKDEQHKVEIMRKANELAEKLKDNANSDSILQETFNDMWSKWHGDLVSSVAKDRPIGDAVHTVLHQEVIKDKAYLKNELMKCPLDQPQNITKLQGSIKLDDVPETYITVKQQVWKTVEKVADDSETNECREKAVDLGNEIFRQVDTYINNLLKKAAKYEDTFTREIIHKIKIQIDNHNEDQEQQNYTVLPTFKVMLLVRACGYSVSRFTDMENEYAEKFGFRKKFEKYEKEVWIVFRAKVKEAEAEVTAAELFCDIIENLVKEHIRHTIPTKVVDDILHYFSMNKFHLLVDILDDLARQASFKNFTAYIRDAKSYAQRWITSFINERLFVKATASDQMGEYYKKCHSSSHAIFTAIRDGMTEAIAQSSFLQDDDVKINQRIEDFCKSIDKILPVTEDHFKQVTEQKVTNFCNFGERVLKQLSEVEARLDEDFKSETAESIRWYGDTPYEKVIEQIWGCDAQCPFCNEPCQHTDKNHLKMKDVSHRCIQHRSSGVRGAIWESNIEIEGRIANKGTLTIESCNYKIQTKTLKFKCCACQNKCKESGECTVPEKSHLYKEGHLYKEYKKFLPDWDISPSPDMESSHYWMWFLTTYGLQLAKHYKRKPPCIPKSWEKIDMTKALNSLRSTYLCDK